jgi:hypothetical protein
VNAAALYLGNAETLLRGAQRNTRGVWPRACAWLLRLALEAALDAYWARVEPSVAMCRSRRAQLLVLERYAGRDTAKRVAYLWWALSRVGHHNGYELAPTGNELRSLHTDVVAVVRMLSKDHR